MKAKLRGIAQVSLAVALALSMSLVTAGPVTATTQLPSLSPTEAEYSLDDRAEVMTAITWGVAKTVDGVSDDDGYVLRRGADRDYVVLLRHLIILSSYLEKKLTDIGDDVVLLVKFDTGAVLFTITATGTNPSISPTTGQYDLDKPIDVKTTVTWGAAREARSIVDGDGYVLKVNTDYSLAPPVDGKSELTIKKSYLEGKLKDIGEGVQLTASFDVGNAVNFGITAAGTFASISPVAAEYDLDAPADVKATLTWGAAGEVESITDGVGYELKATEYDVTRVDEDTATLTIRKSYLEGKLKKIGESVALEFEFDVGNHATLTITAKGTQPKLSPAQEEYDLEEPHDVETTITWGIAKGIKSIKDGDGYVLKAADYALTVPAAGKSTLIVKKSYLEAKLKEVGKTLVLTLEFDVGNDATFTIAAEGNDPGLSPTQKEYDLEEPDDVETTITWGVAKEVKSIVDDGGYELKLTDDYTLTFLAAGKHTLTFKNSYLKGRLDDVGKSLVLTVEFDVGDKATFTINSEGDAAGLFPVREDYDLDEPDDVVTTITWGAAKELKSIVDGDGYKLKAADYSLAFLAAGRHTLTFKNSYLQGKLDDIGKSVVLTVEFDVGAKATFTITAEGVHARLSPPQEEYDLDEPDDVETSIVWGTATKVKSIVDGDGYKLANGPDYSLTPVDADRDTLTFRESYLKGKLKDIGKTLVLTVEFDVGDDATFTVTTEGVQPRLSPPQEAYDLDEPDDVKITIVWGTAKEVKSITDGDGYRLKKDTDYGLTPIDADRATLIILDGTYLQKTLTDVGSEAKLTVKFDVGADATLTIAVDGTLPAISPATADYDYDELDDIEATIWYGSARELKSIVDGDGYRLQEGIDYSLTSIGDDAATLIVFDDPYLKGEELELGDIITLTIDFDVNEATLVITAVGTPPSISPTALEYNILSPEDVETTITWGAATAIVSIVDQNDFELVEGKHYSVTSVRADKATLTILNDEYLKEEIKRIRQLRVLTIDFDVSSGHTLEIRAPRIACFIATAAFGTPMSEEVQVLRDFRDEYMVTNRVGYALVELYYRVSPPIARFISEHAGLRAAVRIGLLPAVALSTAVVNTTPTEKMAITVSLLLASAALAMWATRRRVRLSANN